MDPNIENSCIAPIEPPTAMATLEPLVAAGTTATALPASSTAALGVAAQLHAAQAAASKAAVQAAIAAQAAAAATAGRPFIAPTAAGALPQVNHLLAGATTIMIPGVGLVMHAGQPPAGMSMTMGETTADAEVTAVAQSTTLMDPMAIAHAAAAAAYHQQQMQLQMALNKRPGGSKVPRWSAEEQARLMGLVTELGDKNWKEIAARLGNGRSATAVEQHYNIVIGKRKRSNAQEGEADAGPAIGFTEEGARFARAEEAAAAAAAKQAERQAKALEKEAKATKRAAERAERDQANSAKKAEKEEKKAKREAERAIKAELMKMPKKPHSSYLYFCDETREALKAAHPDTSVPDLAKLQGAAWKALDESEKQVYMDKAAEDLERYKAEMEAGNWYEREKELKRQEEERRIAAGEEPPSKVRAETAARTRTRRAAAAAAAAAASKGRMNDFNPAQSYCPPRAGLTKTVLKLADGCGRGDGCCCSLPSCGRLVAPRCCCHSTPRPAAMARLTLRRPVYARASMAPLAPPSQKSKSPSRKLPRNLSSWYVPEGYAVASQPPTSAQLEFGCEAGDALLGKHILFHWEGVGWCEGILESRNMDSSLMIDEETRDIVNFIVFYAIDDDKSQHNLELQFYGGGPTAAFGNWVLLEPAPSASGSLAEGMAAPSQAKPEEAPQQAP